MHLFSPHIARFPLSMHTSLLSIEGFLKPVPKWSQEGLLDHLVEYIVTEDEVYNPISVN